MARMILGKFHCTYHRDTLCYGYGYGYGYGVSVAGWRNGCLLRYTRQGKSILIHVLIDLDSVAAITGEVFLWFEDFLFARRASGVLMLRFLNERGCVDTCESFVILN